MSKDSDGAHAWRPWCIALIIQAIVVGIEMYSGHHSHSRALFSDILHNGSDILLIIMTAAPFAMKFGTAGHASARTWSVRVNVTSLMVGGFLGIYLGGRALQDPQTVIYHLAWPAALVSLIGNLLIVRVVRSFGHDHGTQVFIWHQLWDVLAAGIATVALLFGSATQASQLDAWASIAIGVFMILHWPMVKRTSHRHA